LARNSPVRTLSRCPARITALFGGDCALAVIAIPASMARIATMTAPLQAISRIELTGDIEFFEAFIKTPHCELAFETRRV